MAAVEVRLLRVWKCKTTRTSWKRNERECSIGQQRKEITLHVSVDEYFTEISTESSDIPDPDSVGGGF